MVFGIRGHPTLQSPKVHDELRLYVNSPSPIVPATSNQFPETQTPSHHNPPTKSSFAYASISSPVEDYPREFVLRVRYPLSFAPRRPNISLVHIFLSHRRISAVFVWAFRSRQASSTHQHSVRKPSSLFSLHLCCFRILDGIMTSIFSVSTILDRSIDMFLLDCIESKFHCTGFSCSIFVVCRNRRGSKYLFTFSFFLLVFLLLCFSRWHTVVCCMKPCEWGLGMLIGLASFRTGMEFEMHTLLLGWG